MRKEAINGVIASYGPKNAEKVLDERIKANGLDPLTKEEREYIRTYSKQNQSGHFINKLK